MSSASTPARLLALLSAGVLALALAACSSSAPTAESSSAEPAPVETVEPAEPTAEDIEGRWCPTPESAATEGCVTIALPNAVYDDTVTVELSEPVAGDPADGFAFSTPGAPFGTYFPAGFEIPGGTPDYYPGADLPDQDRIWNGQTGALLLRATPPEITAANCADVSGSAALVGWSGELPAAPSAMWDIRDTMGWAAETYDACTALSWIVVPLTDCCLGGYPFAVMLFHEGEFAGMATEEIYGRFPEVARVADDELTITWSWVPDGGSNAGPYDTATSTFTWDDEVVRTGDLPPVSF